MISLFIAILIFEYSTILYSLALLVCLMATSAHLLYGYVFSKVLNLFRMTSCCQLSEHTWSTCDHRQVCL